MMAFESNDYYLDDSNDEYIDFEAEQELFKLFNPRSRAANPSISVGPKPYPDPSTNPTLETKDEDKYVLFELFDENGNRNWIKF